MSKLNDLPVPLAHGGSVQRGVVTGLSDEGFIAVLLDGAKHAVECLLLNPDASGLPRPDARVLVWLGASLEPADKPVVLGTLGMPDTAAQPVAEPDEFAKRPVSMVIETQGDLVLQNGQARIKLGKEGDVEILCSSFTARSRRLLRLLAPFIKLN